MLAKASLRARLIGLCLFIYFIVVLVGVVGVQSISVTSRTAAEENAMAEASAAMLRVESAHLAWLNALSSAVFQEAQFTGALDPDKCALGQLLSSGNVKGVDDPVIDRLLGQLKEPHALMHQTAAKVLQLVASGDAQGAQSLYETEIVPRCETTVSLLSDMGKHFDSLRNTERTERESIERTVTLIVWGIVVGGFIIGLAVAFSVLHSVMVPLRALTASFRRLALGDLTYKPLNYAAKDQIGAMEEAMRTMVESMRAQAEAMERLASGDLTVEVSPRSEQDVTSHAIARMIVSLNEMFREIQASTVQVASNSKQISNGAQILAQGTTEQAAAIEQLSASIAAVSSKSQETAANAGNAAVISESIKKNAQLGAEQMNDLMRSMKDINEASRSIEKVIKVIDDIASQTRILALNATVEAAHAGVQGKGFTVVAEEVRSLAAKSADAAKDTAQLIADSIEKAVQGARIAQATAASLASIVQGVSESTSIVRDISQASDMQSGAITQISQSIQQVAHVVQQNTGVTQESASSSQELSNQAEMLEQLIGQFSLKNNGSQTRALAERFEA